MNKSAWDIGIDFVLYYEGGYDNDPNDRGGETFRGVSRVNWPKWEGWLIIDNVKASLPTTFKSALMNDADLKSRAVEFYRKNFWDQIHGDELPGKLAVAVLDMAVHSGPRPAARLLQTVLNMEVDGDIGPKTVAAAHMGSESTLIAYLAARAVFLHNLMANDKTQSGWALNWFKRLFKLAALVLEGEGVEFDYADPIS
jgi:lysozyme family protein